MSDPQRPVLRYHGGKWLLAPWIIENLPPHRVYVEPFGGAASVLMRKQRSYAEIYNELSDDVVNLFCVLRDADHADRLRDVLELTPFARAEFEQAYVVSDDPIERARRLLIRSFMGFGSNGHNIRVKTGFRANSNRSGTTPSHDWPNYLDCLPAIIERLKGVTIEHRDAIECMCQHDGIETLHYVDPPYVMATRSVANPYDLKYRAKGSMHRAGCYDHEMSDEDHAVLLDALCDLNGMVVLSGYAHPLYDNRLAGWQRKERAALADGARDRTEVLWINRRASEALADAEAQGTLFAEAAA